MSFTAEKIFISRHGGPEELYLKTVSLPEPGSGEVVVRQDAIGVNYLDVYHRSGAFPLGQLPSGIGVGAAGTIEAVGPGVTRLREGDRVSYAGPPVGSYTNRRILPENMLMKLPSGITNPMAAAITLQGMTAHMLMTRIRPLKAGETVLVHSAAGGLGLIIVQWAKSLGARVIGTVGSSEKAALARSMGADVAILYKEVDFTAAVRELTRGEGVDVVYDGVGGDTFRRSLHVIKPFGLAVTLGQTSGTAADVRISDLGHGQSISVSAPGVSTHLQTVPDIQEAGDELFEKIGSGTLKVHLAATFKIDQTADAHRLIESGRSTGSIVIEA